MCHEAALRATARRFFIPLPGGEDSPENLGRVLQLFVADNGRERIDALGSLTLLTALCAAVTYVVPESSLPDKHLTAPLFLRAARETLRIYEYYDIEHPDFSSLATRLFLCSAIQNSTGTHGVAFHILGEAGLIAMKMRLFDESSPEGRETLEANLLRNAFWQLYMCDKTALIMKTRPITIHEPLFGSELTLRAHSRMPVPLFDHGWDVDGGEVEERLLEGFHIIRRLWAVALRVIQGMESISKESLEARSHTNASCESIAHLSEAYFEMVTLANNLPALVRSPSDSSASVNRDADQHLFNIMQRQRTIYLITLHSIKVLVPTTAIQHNMTEAMGLSAGRLTLARRKIELAQDFLKRPRECSIPTSPGGWRTMCK
ncbi:hypothetical protein LTR64_008303 [Lithohypha guttulata]|uniref:uncharacterized protein n=1 Tax=Lithohypha guttulata TaxID=1690604 RepID=UPI002DDEDD4C|nr:hypothetical protein LTR51_008455 [Lithohypha guttulata]